ncbi:unnamed protein product [Ostreobium quekettii]|uniref:Glucose-6-phosphate 1-dehydrogenase n=1 Tax=Ostreobium quekettii TaxID=121088 RepID=A0A8S1JBE9_9CHLO|nr:unnamed protein product [Ostreobium quekettii]|eukprot:evm.model.scf_454.5 EVM.evm.TU.scf_454.5   scf_454:41695-50038(+)
MASARDTMPFCDPSGICLTVVVLGASGDLAKKKTYPALYALYHRGFLPPNLRVVGYARSALTDEDLRSRLKGFLKGEEDSIDKFLASCSYVRGEYNGSEGYEKLQEILLQREGEMMCPSQIVGRLFYLALPPSVYPQVCTGLRHNCTDLDNAADNPKNWIRIIVEKPFGKDLQSSEQLADSLGALFPEDQLYRIDHYLGKELAQNMTVMRFANTFYNSWWHRDYISNVQITFKENFGTQGRGGYFDQFGIIRDVIQNHLIQLLALVAMEKPVSLHPDDIRDEKTRVLRCIAPATVEDTVLGQYVATGDEPGYLDDPTVPPGSKTPTFAACTLYVRNDRWYGVPFVLKAGKALNERKAEVRIQLKPTPASLYLSEGMRNEFVMRLQPGEAIYMKTVVKKPGLEMDTEMSELDLSYTKRYSGVHIPEAYERLILDAIRGDQQHFVRRDELRAAWAIFTPLLHQIDEGALTPEPYDIGSRGPASADALLARAGFEKGAKYTWNPSASM